MGKHSITEVNEPRSQVELDSLRYALGVQRDGKPRTARHHGIYKGSMDGTLARIRFLRRLRLAAKAGELG